MAKKVADQKVDSLSIYHGEVLPLYWEARPKDYERLMSALSSQNENDLFEILSAFDLENISDYKECYIETNNPLMVWRAIRFCCAPPLARYSAFTPKIMIRNLFFRSDIKGNGCVEWTSDFDIESLEKWCIGAIKKRSATLAIPDWCQEYLGLCSNKISILSHSDEKHKAEKISEILGFQRPGWNAFKDKKNRERDASLFLRVHDLIYGGMTKTEAQETAAEEFGIKDRRSVQRIIAAMLTEGDKT